MMRKKKIHAHKRLVALSLVMVLVTGFMSGCAKKVDLTKEEQELVAEYAAQLVLKHDKNYNGKLKEIDTKETATNNKTPETDSHAGNADETLPANNGSSESFSEVFGFGALNVDYSGYQVLDTYPQTSDVAFVLKATEGTGLLILKFNVSNPTGSAVDVPMMPFDTSVKSVINDNDNYSALVTLLMDGLNTFSGTVAAGESRELVLAFQTPYTDGNAIDSLKLKVSKDGNNSIFNLK